MADRIPSTTRRGLIVGAAGSLVAASAHAAPKEVLMADLKKEADIACLYHCDYGDPARFAQTLNNISNHYSAHGADPFGLQLVIVAHGPSVKFFLASLDESPWKDETLDPKIFERVSDLAKNGLKVHLCEITFKRLKLDKSKVHDVSFVDFVPSGVATVAALQSKGFSYLKVG